MKKIIGIIILLFICTHVRAQLSLDTCVVVGDISYCIIKVCDYSFKELVNEGINTSSRRLDILHVPIRQFQFVIKAFLKFHSFSINKRERRRTTFRVIAFTYPSVSPQGDTIMLSGLVSFPILDGNNIQRMLIFHRLTAVSNSIAPSNSTPIEAVLSADNTICVFPDYYGCGISEENPLPFVALNYHARCATECALAALDIVKENGVVLAPDFYTWNTGYSQGGGYALATQKYIENVLPDSQSRRINLRWSLCYGGIYSPAKLYKTAIVTGDMGNSPSVFLQSLRGLFVSHKDMLDSVTISDLLSEKAIESGLDSLLQTYDDGLFDLADRLDGRDRSRNPADYFCASALDTSSSLYKKVEAAFLMDECGKDWHPRSKVVFGHSKKDKTIPFQLTVHTKEQLVDTCDNTVLRTPLFNGSHSFTAFIYDYTLLLYREDELFNKYIDVVSPCD